ncbi:twin-arginine translocase TatA/TatE family subunit [Leucobacter triazinivorans]|uniref:Sec-independent protein translocase protein TatA n=1 Tax=Leucobacter triazinivorans TaxID=1784719 RepID=A0A4P6KF37_9MICO|nr:twin-arginine translocase TatA/TatE family subunit [Leucobacter triazinivorans]QBE48571.1 preprotein translocase [Leucobacter triazinivorans]
MLGNLGGWHLLAILFVMLLLFGAPKLPALAKSLGQSMRILKTEARGGSGEAQDPAPSGHRPDVP